MYKSTPIALKLNETSKLDDNTADSVNRKLLLDNTSDLLQGSSKKNINSKSNDTNEIKSVIQEMEIIRDYPEFEKMFAKCRDNSNISKVLDLAEITESEIILDTPPNSSSPEIMDSGYPNSASAHDMTPEYDLPSIEQDRISNSKSPSIENDDDDDDEDEDDEDDDRISDSESPINEEAPRQGFFELELENGDLANNNRDDEGNNMIAVEDNDNDDLQPLIHVLANDRENENDIYVLQNGFPAWLLRILRMQGQRFGPLDAAIGK